MEISLPPQLTTQILEYLGCPREKPSVRYLNRLIQAHIHHVPWESATRIIKRHTTPDTADCPRWPDEFWSEALSNGTGGTCFECNLAFYTLLTTLGFEGYLTINDMEKPACHTACILTLHRQKYLADVAIPIHCAVPVRSQKITRRATPFHFYTIRPDGASSYRIERSHHPKRLAFTLRDIPIPMVAYRAAVTRDYEPGGFFLDRVIIVKVVDNRLWRFSSADQPYKLEGFDKTSKEEILLPSEDMAQTIAGRFGIRESKIDEALGCVRDSGAVAKE